MRRTAFALGAFLPLVGCPLAPSAAWANVAQPAGVPASRATGAAATGSPLWTGSREAETRRDALLALLAIEAKADPAPASSGALEVGAAPSADPEDELGATRAALAYLSRRNGGEPVTAAGSRRAIQRLDRGVPGSGLAAALLELEVVQDLGGWRRVGTLPGPLPTVPPATVASPEVDVAPALPRRKVLPEPLSLRQRLVQSADLPASQLGRPEMDAELTAAVRRFQARHGLAADGVVGARTLAALNAPVSAQIAQIRLNLARAAPGRAHLARYVEVNVPGFELRVVEHGEVVLRSRAIVGERDNATPIFDDWIRYIEVNPSWYVPASIVPELLEKEEKRPGYLATSGFQWRGSAEPGARQTLVQKPGPDNALGRIKFLFPNHHAVYLHDTSQPKLFGRSQRSLSHGCVRVEKPDELALALLGDQGWDAARLQRAYRSRKTQRVELAEPVPVFLDYRTAFTDDAGRLQLRADLYRHDRNGVVVFPGKGLPPEAQVADEEVAAPVVNRPASLLVPTAAAARPAT